MFTDEVQETLEVTYAEAISLGTCFAMAQDERTIILGIGTQYPSGIFGTTSLALSKFGPSRVLDVPAMENALTGIASGMATEGLHPLIVHARADFMALSFDQIINLLSKWRYMFGGEAGSCPVVIRSIIGRGWGQGATHSQSFHSILGHIPGLRVLLPFSIQDARDMVCQSLLEDIPSVIFEHRSLYSMRGPISNDSCTAEVPFNKPIRVRRGDDVTLIGLSYGVSELLRVAEILESRGIFADVIDMRSLWTADMELIAESVNRTKNLLVHDVSWLPFGATSEIITRLFEINAINQVKVRRSGTSFTPAPASYILEEFFYPSIQNITKEVLLMLDSQETASNLNYKNKENEFLGPY